MSADKHLTIPGALEWDSGSVERFTIATLRYAVGSEHDVRYVSERDYDAALAREAALREELDQCGAMAAMIEDKEWAEHAGSGPVSSRVESAFTQLHNELAALRESYESMRDRKNSIVDLQQRLTVAEQREAEAREELLELSRKLEVFYSRSHGIKNLSEIEKANDKAKSLKLRVGKCEALLNMSRELLTTISRHGATTRPVDWCESFKSEVADRIEKIGAALKPAAEGEGS